MISQLAASRDFWNNFFSVLVIEVINTIIWLVGHKAKPLGRNHHFWKQAWAKWLSREERNSTLPKQIVSYALLLFMLRHILTLCISEIFRLKNRLGRVWTCCSLYIFRWLKNWTELRLVFGLQRWIRLLTSFDVLFFIVLFPKSSCCSLVLLAIAGLGRVGVLALHSKFGKLIYNITH